MKLIFLILSLWFGACAVHASQPLELLKGRINAAHTPTEVLDTYLGMLPEFAPRERIPIAGYLYTFIVTGETSFVPKKKFKISRGAPQDKKQKLLDALVTAAYFYKSREKIQINPKDITNRVHAALCEKVFTQARDYFSTHPPLRIDGFTPSEQKILGALMRKPLSAEVLTDYYDAVEAKIDHPTAVVVSPAPPKAPPPPAAASPQSSHYGSNPAAKRKQGVDVQKDKKEDKKENMVEQLSARIKSVVDARRASGMDGTQSESEDEGDWSDDDKIAESSEEKELERQKQEDLKIEQVQLTQKQEEAARRRKEELEKQRQAQEKEAKEKAALVAAQATKPSSVKMLGDATKPIDLPTTPKEKPKATEAPIPDKTRIQLAKEAIVRGAQEKEKALETQKAQAAEQRKLEFKKAHSTLQ